MKPCDSLVAPRSPEDAARLADLYARMGVGMVLVEASDPGLARRLVKVFQDRGVDAYARITVEVKEWGKGVTEVRRAAQAYDIVAVRPRSAEAARLAARDPGVALIQLPPGMARYMDRSQALMLREGRAAVEIKLQPLLHPGDPRRSLRGLMVIARRAAAYEAPLVVGSGARLAWEAWPPQSVVGLLVSFGVPEPLARLYVYKNCRSVVRLYVGGDKRR